MKKNKFLGITASICALSAVIAPLATMSSCGKKEEDKQIPVDKLWITHDGILSGIDPTLDLSQYTTLVLPDKVVEIAPEAFRGYFAPHSGKQCNVTKIVFDKNLRRIGAKAFMGCETLTDLDFVAVDPLSWLTMEKTDAFDGMVGYGQGTVHYAGYQTDLEDNIVKSELVQISKMPIDWFVPKQINELTWDVNKSPWKPLFKPVDRPLAKGGYRAMIDYAEAVMADKTVFIDDIINSLVNILPSGAKESAWVTIRDIDMSNNIVAHQVEASFEMSLYKNDKLLTVKYEKMPLIMSIPEGLDENETEFNSAIRISSKLETMSSWGNSKIRYSTNYGEEEIINSASSLSRLPEDLYNLVYGKFQIVSNFYKNQVIDVKVNMNDINVEDGILKGFDPNIDTSLYSVLDLSGFTDVNKINQIDKDAFDVFKQAECKRLSKIIFPSTLGHTEAIPEDGYIPAQAFKDIPTLKELDFSLLKAPENGSAIETYNKIMEHSPDAFVGLSNAKSGHISLPSGLDDELFGKAVANTFQIAKLPRNFTNINSLVFKQLEWDSRKEGQSNWEPIWNAIEAKPAMDAKEAAQEYAKVIDKNPGVLIDDFMNAYANIIPSSGTLTQSISNVSVDVENANASFTVTFNDGATTITVEYSKMPFLLVQPEKYAQYSNGYKCAIVFDKMTLESYTGAEWPNGTGFTVTLPDQTKINVASPDELDELREEHEEIAKNVYDDIEIASNYFKKQEVFRAVPQTEDIFNVEMGELTHVNLTPRQKQEYTTLEIPEQLQTGGKIRTIRKDAIIGLSGDTCKINQITFPSGLEKIETYALTACSAIEKLNFIGMGQGEFSQLDIGQNAFSGVSNKLGKGQIVTQSMTPAEFGRIIVSKFINNGGLSAEWLEPSFIKQLRWDIIDSDTKLVNEFTNMFTKVTPATQASASEYLGLIKTNSLMFINDFFYTYTNELLPQDQGYKIVKDEETISNITVSDDEQLSFNVSLSLAAEPEPAESELQPYSYDVNITFTNIKIKYDSTNKYFAFDEETLLNDNDWSITFNGKKTINGNEIAIDEIRDKDDITPEGKAAWAEEQPHLYKIAYELAKIYSGFYDKE